MFQGSTLVGWHSQLLGRTTKKWMMPLKNSCLAGSLARLRMQPWHIGCAVVPNGCFWFDQQSSGKLPGKMVRSANWPRLTMKTGNSREDAMLGLLKHIYHLTLTCHGFARSSEGRGLGGLAADLMESRCFFINGSVVLLRSSWSCWSCLCVFCRKSMVFIHGFYMFLSVDIYI